MATQTLPLISKNPAFRVDPDKYLREYRLPFEKKTLRQTLPPPPPMESPLDSLKNPRNTLESIIEL